MTTRRRWLLAGGGTGGHVALVLALAEVLRDAGDAVLVLGSEHGLEKRLVPEAGFALEALPSRQVMGRGLFARLGAAVGIGVATLRALGVLRRFRPDLVLSVGGYASVPAVLAGAALRTPVALVEPNAVPGRANRLAARFARRLFVGFEEAAAHFARRHPGRVYNFGTPTRSAVRERIGPARARREPQRPLHLLVFGGSQGARQLNEAMLEAANRLDPGSFTIFHQTGEADRERVARAYAEAGLAAEVVAYEPELPERYAWADVALCRAGALSVAELAIAGLPALLVPYPWAADDHQTANARELVAAGAARLLDPRSFGAEAAAQALAELAARPERLRAMAEAAAKLARPDAALHIVEECRRMLGEAA